MAPTQSVKLSSKRTKYDCGDTGSYCTLRAVAFHIPTKKRGERKTSARFPPFVWTHRRPEIWTYWFYYLGATPTHISNRTQEKPHVLWACGTIFPLWKSKSKSVVSEGSFQKSVDLA